MSRIQKTFLLALFTLGLYSPTAPAKGLGDLKPSAAEDKAKEGETPEGEKKEEPSAVEVKAVETKMPPPTGNIYVNTSFGFVSAKKESKDWKAAGMSDVLIGYKIPMAPVMGATLFGSFRYAPIDVAPQIEKDGEGFEYVGVIEGYHFGATGRLPLGDSLKVVASGELGYMVVHLKDRLNLKEDSPPEDGGVALTLGGGADWELLQGFELGARLRVGVGSFTTFQLGGGATFIF